MNTTTGEFDPAAAGGGSHVITYTLNGCEEETIIVVNVAPTAQIADVYGPYCSDDDGETFMATPLGGTWTGAGITDASAGTFDPMVAGAGDHIITYTFTDGNGCTDTDEITVTVNPRPNISVTTDPPGIPLETCSGESIRLLASSDVPILPQDFQWIIPEGATSTVTTGSVIVPVATNFSDSPIDVTYQVVGTTLAGCVDTGSITITVLPAPEAILTINGLDVNAFNLACNGDLATIAVNTTGGTGAVSYTWSLPGGNFEFTETITVGPGSYTVTVTDNNGCPAIGAVAEPCPAWPFAGIVPRARSSQRRAANSLETAVNRVLAAFAAKSFP